MPRPPPTEAELAAARARAEAARRAADREEQALAELLEAAQERLQLEIARLRGEQGLHPSNDRSNLPSNMQPNLATKPTSLGGRISAARSTTTIKTASKVAAIAADAPDQKIATFLGVGRSTVQAWHAGRVPVPPQHAKAMQKKFGIPVSSWPKLG